MVHSKHYISCLCFFGFFEGVEWAKNIAYFIAWFFIVISFFLLSDEATKLIAKEMKKNKLRMPVVVNNVFDLCVTLALIAAGAWVTGIFYIVHCLFCQVAKERAKGLLRESKQ